MPFVNLIFKLAAFALKCFVAMVMFNWFVPSAFSIPAVGYVTTIGVMLLINFTKNQQLYDKAEETAKKSTADDGYFLKNAFVSIFFSLFTLSVAFLVKCML